VKVNLYRRWASGFFLLLTLAAAPASQVPAADAQADGYVRSGLAEVLASGGRVEWSHDGETIFFDRLEADGLWDVWRMAPDGTEQSCLTCDQAALPNKHQGQPAEHPSGRYVVFQAEKAVHSFGSGTAISAPGAGVYNDLWVLDLQAQAFHQLTDVWSGVPVGGSLHPHFNADGTRLIWGDLEAGGPEFGNWRIAVAEFVALPVPHLQNILYDQPGAQQNWYETHGFISEMDVLITAAPLSGMNDRAMDIYGLRLADQQLTRLTFTAGTGGEPSEWDEHAHMAPAGDAIAWMSSAPYGADPSAPVLSWLRCELWLMDADGGDKQRLTFFNEAGHGEYQGGGQVCVSDMTWNPDGTRLAMYVQFLDSAPPDRVWIMDFTPPSVGGDVALPETSGGERDPTGMLIGAAAVAVAVFGFFAGRRIRRRRKAV
jgi:Tol biopolymer transport system component